jgi:hypothetical protein
MPPVRRHGLHVLLGLPVACLPGLSNAADSFTFTCRVGPFGSPMIVSGELPKGHGVIVTNRLPPIPVSVEAKTLDSIAISTKNDPSGSFGMELYRPNPQRRSFPWVVISRDHPSQTGQTDCEEGLPNPP